MAQCGLRDVSPRWLQWRPAPALEVPVQCELEPPGKRIQRSVSVKMITMKIINQDEILSFLAILRALMNRNC